MHGLAYGEAQPIRVLTELVRLQGWTEDPLPAAKLEEFHTPTVALGRV